MHTATWPSLKSSPMMSEIREALKKKAAPGEATLSRKEANRTWREDILGIRSEEQKQIDKAKKQERNTKKKKIRTQDEE
jgi:hypothetical protein